MTLESMLQFYRRNLSVNDYLDAREKAIKETSVQEAVMMKISYTELLNRNYLRNMIIIYRQQKRKKERGL